MKKIIYIAWIILSMQVFVLFVSGQKTSTASPVQKGQADAAKVGEVKKYVAPDGSFSVFASSPPAISQRPLGETAYVWARENEAVEITRNDNPKEMSDTEIDNTIDGYINFMRNNLGKKAVIDGDSVAAGRFRGRSMIVQVDDQTVYEAMLIAGKQVLHIRRYVGKSSPAAVKEMNDLYLSLNKDTQ